MLQKYVVVVNVGWF